jgi:co-chaperonin GroES (HSP10)
MSNLMKARPAPSFLIVLMREKSMQEENSIFERTDRKGADSWGDVVRIPDGETDYRVGDRVLIPRTAGQVYQEGGKSYVLVHKLDVRMFIHKDDCDDENDPE